MNRHDGGVLNAFDLTKTVRNGLSSPWDGRLTIQHVANNRQLTISQDHAWD
jgi:hypothetical protein